MDLSVSIVTYKNDEEILMKAVNSVLDSEGLSFKLYIVDNSPTDELRHLFVGDDRIEYLFGHGNVGYGSGHNIIMKNKEKIGRYHLVLNPDIFFENEILKNLVSYMDRHPDVGNIIPRTLVPNTGKDCAICKLLPTPFDLFLRMLIPVRSLRKKSTTKYQMLFADMNQSMNVPFLSGCFMFLRASIFEDIGYFDERIFMYAEDTDLNRRIHIKYLTLYYPELVIYHYGAAESHKKLKMMWISIKSCAYYFNKWGWFFDEDRRLINKKTVSEYSK